MELAELSKLVDAFNEARTERLKADKIAAGLKSAENQLKQRILHEMLDQDVGFASGKAIRVKLQTKEKPKCNDWSALHEYMVKNDSMDLMQKRLHEGAIKLRLEEGIEVPGIEFVEINDLSVGKL